VVAEMTTVMGFIHQREDIKNNIRKEKKRYLDSSVAMWLQYLRSSIPVIVIAFDDILMQRPPLFFRIQNSCNRKHECLLSKTNNLSKQKAKHRTASSPDSR